MTPSPRRLLLSVLAGALVLVGSLLLAALFDAISLNDRFNRVVADETWVYWWWAVRLAVVITVLYLALVRRRHDH